MLLICSFLGDRKTYLVSKVEGQVFGPLAASSEHDRLFLTIESSEAEGAVLVAADSVEMAIEGTIIFKEYIVLVCSYYKAVAQLH